MFSASTKTFLFLFNLDMTNLTGCSKSSGNNLSINNDTTANTRSKCYHNYIFMSFSCSLPHFSQGSYICIISYHNVFNSRKPFHDFYNINNSPSKVYTFINNCSLKDRTWYSNSNPLNFILSYLFFLAFISYRICNIF